MTELKTYYVWDAGIRWFHWLNLLCMLGLIAVGVAILRSFGTTPEVSRGRVFEQDQIARAAELGLGVNSPEQIELVTGDAESQEFASTVKKFLLA